MKKIFITMIALALIITAILSFGHLFKAQASENNGDDPVFAEEIITPLGRDEESREPAGE